MRRHLRRLGCGRNRIGTCARRHHLRRTATTEKNGYQHKTDTHPDGAVNAFSKRPHRNPFLPPCMAVVPFTQNACCDRTDNVRIPGAPPLLFPLRGVQRARRIPCAPHARHARLAATEGEESVQEVNGFFARNHYRPCVFTLPVSPSLFPCWSLCAGAPVVLPSVSLWCGSLPSALGGVRSAPRVARSVGT